MTDLCKVAPSEGSGPHVETLDLFLDLTNSMQRVVSIDFLLSETLNLGQMGSLVIINVHAY